MKNNSHVTQRIENISWRKRKTPIHGMPRIKKQTMALVLSWKRTVHSQLHCVNKRNNAAKGNHAAEGFVRL